MAKDKQTYMNNPNLPTTGAEFEYTPAMVKDLKKCQKNILHFAEKFFYIISLDEGKKTIDLHYCQKRALRKMRDNRFFILLASRQIGKALALNTPVPSPNGWTSMGEIKDGDVIYDSNGQPCNVIKAHDILYDRVCYEVEFDNGEKIVADAEHNWFTQSKLERRKKINGSVKTTQELFETVNYYNEPMHRIPSVRGAEQDLPKELVENKNRSNWHYIKKIKEVNSVPVRCITVDSEDSLFLVGKQYIPTHNTTMMTIYALWVACFNDDQRILIVANKEGTALEIMSRIRLAYEELPNWLKPGVKEYGKTSIVLANGTRIGISTTTGTAARGQSVGTLILDELAFIEPHLVDDFWKSVYPIVSSSKKSKIFIASTANGTDNLFYKLYSGAEQGENGWACDKILWNEIPGRNEKWKQDTIASIGSTEAWMQEFECEFISSGESSVNDELFEKLTSKTSEPLFVFDDGKYLLWDEPKEDRIYVASVDTSEGLGKDASVIQILDYTDLTNINQVAVYHNNEISPYNFTEKVYEVLQHWGNPLVCIERNNSGGQVADILKNTHDYENIVSWGGSLASRKKQQLGIISHTNTKYKGVANMRYWINELESVQINDKRTVKELKNYVKAPNGTWNAKKGYHDDLVTSLMWNLIILVEDIVETYFEVVKKDTNNRPLELQQMDFGIKYFMNPTSLYTNEKEGLSNTLPVIIGNASNTNSEIDQLQMQGYKVWGP